MRVEYVDGMLTFFLTGRIDSANVASLEDEIATEMSFYDDENIAFDASALEYISSAGLRILLKLKKLIKKPVRVCNVSDEVYDIFSVTGFTEIFEVERVMRQVSVKGCEKVSSALNGEIYSLSEDEIVKVYGKEIPLFEIRKERDYAQTALIAGVPTLIPYDVVKCEGGYGIVFEKAGAESLSYMLMRDTENLDMYANMFAGLMREMHETEIEEGKLPDIKTRYREWLNELQDVDDTSNKMFFTLIDSIPDSGTYVHGDINLNSVMVKDGELLLLDMAGSARGNSLFDLQGVFASLVAIDRKEEGYCRKTFGLSRDTCTKFWNSFFKIYMKDRPTEMEKMNELLSKSFILKERVLDQIERRHRMQGMA